MENWVGEVYGVKFKIMDPINTEDYTKYSLELIFNEADKLAQQMLKALSENVNKSFVMFAIYSSVFSYSFIKLIDRDYLFLILILGTSISCLFIGRNLFPKSISFNGALPENMINNYYNHFSSEELDKEYLATQIQTYNTSMEENRSVIEKMAKRFKLSVISLLISFILFGIFFLISFIECS